MLLSLPDTWHYSVRGLAAISLEGVDGILTALKELETHGYLERRQLRQPNGRLGQTEYVILKSRDRSRAWIHRVRKSRIR